MPFAQGLPDCSTVVLAGAEFDATVDAAGLRALIAACGANGPFELFCAPPSTEAGLDAGARLRWHAPTADLGRALRALAALPDHDASRDVVWVVAGTTVPAGWDLRLRASLQADAAVGTVSPLCAADALYSPFEPGRRPDVSNDAIDNWLRDTRSATPAQMPRPMRLCGAMRAAAREAVVRAGADADWAMTVARAGFAHAACAAVSVGAPEGWTASAPGDAGASLLGLEGLADTHPLLALRQDIDVSTGLQAAPARATRLHVSHSWGGGLGNWVRDFCRADGDHDGLVLRALGVRGAFGRRLALYHGSEPTTPLRVWALDLPIHATAIAHLQYRAILQEIVEEFGVESIVVSSLIGHSLDVLRTRLPTLIVAHDHMPLCVALYAHFDGECRGCDAARLASCIATNPAHAFFQGVRAEDWQVLREAFAAEVLRQDLTIVAPSPSTAARWRALMPELAGARIEVIGHGVDLPPRVAFAPPADGRLRLVKIGRLSPEKGAALLEAALPELLTFAEITLIGCGDAAVRLGRHPGVTAIAHFEPAELPGLIAQARPHLGLQLSVVPETFSYTLSELWHAGVPVLGCRTGSLADRIRDGDNGFLCEPSAASLLARLRELDGRRDVLAAIAARLRDTPGRSCAQMVADYQAVLPPPPRHPAGRLALASGGDTRRERVGPISIDHEAGYTLVARAFGRYTLTKAAHSPRLPAGLRALLRRLARRSALPPARTR